MVRELCVVDLTQGTAASEILGLKWIAFVYMCVCVNVCVHQQWVREVWQRTDEESSQ